MDARELPLLFVDNVVIGALEGTGDSVQITFSSPHAGPHGVDQVPAVRVAMTRLAFMGLAEIAQSVAAEISSATEASAKQKN